MRTTEVCGVSVACRGPGCGGSEAHVSSLPPSIMLEAPMVAIPPPSSCPPL